MDNKTKKTKPNAKAILTTCIAFLAAIMIYLDIPAGIQEIVLGYEYIPEDFGQTQALDVAFLDVGQGDCSLVGSNGQYVLIDSGENEMGNTVLRYLDQLKIDTIDVMILTHPHSDHIGGADVVIKGKDVKSVYMPEATSNTKTFEDVLDAIDENGLEIDIPDVGDVLELDGMTIEFVHPSEGEKYDNTNNVSITVRILNGYGSALFTGDIEASAEGKYLLPGLYKKRCAKSLPSRVVDFHDGRVLSSCRP